MYYILLAPTAPWYKYKINKEKAGATWFEDSAPHIAPTASKLPQNQLLTTFY